MLQIELKLILLPIWLLNINYMSCNKLRSNRFHDFRSRISNLVEGFQVAGYQDREFAVQVGPKSAHPMQQDGHETVNPSQSNRNQNSQYPSHCS
uniref:Uncharacterized protein n=1 Tax=Helianthus annuus TaxID=4232 RepID=A0A251U003_HELAN